MKWPRQQFITTLLCSSIGVIVHLCSLLSITSPLLSLPDREATFSIYLCLIWYCILLRFCSFTISLWRGKFGINLLVLASALVSLYCLPCLLGNSNKLMLLPMTTKQFSNLQVLIISSTLATLGIWITVYFPWSWRVNPYRIAIFVNCTQTCRILEAI